MLYRHRQLFYDTEAEYFYKIIAEDVKTGFAAIRYSVDDKRLPSAVKNKMVIGMMMKDWVGWKNYKRDYGFET